MSELRVMVPGELPSPPPGEKQVVAAAVVVAEIAILLLGEPHWLRFPGLSGVHCNEMGDEP